MDDGEDSWIDAEIERELNALSLEDLEKEEADGDGGVAVTPGRPDNGGTQAVEEEAKAGVTVEVASLFTGYRASLQDEHEGVEVLMSDAKETLDALQGLSLDAYKHELSGSGYNSSLPACASAEQASEGGRATSSDLSESAISGHVCGISVEEEVSSDPKELSSTACESTDSSLPATAEGTEADLRLEELDLEQAEKQKALSLLIAESKRKRRERDTLLAERAALEAAKRLAAAVVLQAHWRGHTARRICRPLFAELRERRLKMDAARHAASVVLQTRWRGYTARKQYKAEVRERRSKMAAMIRAAVALQSHWRRCTAQKRYKAKVREKHSKMAAMTRAAVALQSHWRGRVARTNLKTLKTEQRKAAEEEMKAKLQATVCIQKHWKGFVMRKEFRKKLADLRKKKKLEQEQLLQMRAMQKHKAATIIQTHWRGWMARTAYLKQLEKKRNESKKVEESGSDLGPVASPSGAKSFQSIYEHDKDEQSESALDQPPTSLTTILPVSPGKLTIAKRITSALKLLKHSSEVGFSEQLAKHPESSIKSSSLPLIQASPTSSERQQQDGATVETDEWSDEEDEQKAKLDQEEKALKLLAERREREELIAQLSRERMEKMISAEEVAQVARTKRSYVTYRQELEHASVPMSPFAWAGLIEERWSEWRKTHSTWIWPCIQKQSPAHNTTARSKQVPAGTKALSKAQLLASSAKGTSLTEVASVMVHGSRAPVELASLSQCPLLHCLSLTKCGVASLSGLNNCKCLVDVSMTSNKMEHVDCTGLPQLLFLELADNRLASIHGLGGCASLLELSLAENRVARIAGVKGCSRLQRLNVDGNLVINCKGLEDLPMLQEFSCAENHLPCVQGLQNCSLLQSLNLNQNNLQEIPSLPSHVLLRELLLSENSLSDLSPITNAWLPLLQTLALANNCITEMGSLSCLIMLETLDISNNSLHDLPVFLQSVKACFRLKKILLHGNPITEENRYRSYLIKALPHLEKLDDQPLTNRKAVKLPEAVASSQLMQLCSRQITEQDDMKSKHQQETEAVTTEDLSNPQTAIRLVKNKAAFCFEYERLLISHLREHEAFVPQREGRQMAERRHGPSLQTVRAAVNVQKVWRGRRARKMVALRRVRLNCAATVIQANFRGYWLRKRLREALARIQQQAEAEATERAVAEFSNDGKDFDYEQEVKLDYLDESLLDAELGPLSPPPAELLLDPSIGLLSAAEMEKEEEEEKKVKSSHPISPPHRSQKMLTVPVYGIPGAADCEVGIDVWRESELKLLHTEHTERPSQRRQISQPPLHQKSLTENDRAHKHQQMEKIKDTLHDQLGPRTTSDLQPSPERVQLAWGSSAQLDEEEEGEDERDYLCEDLELQSESGSEVTPSARSEGQTGDDVKKESISNEWGFKSSTTAGLMLKRAKRQKKLKAAAIKRKKLSDPDERLAMFKKQESGLLLKAAPEERGGAAATQRRQYHQGHGTLQPSSPVHLRQRRATKGDSLYRWVHNQQVEIHNTALAASSSSAVRELRLREDTRSKAQHQQSWHSLKASATGVLPQLEPHVLAGHTPRLVSSEAQNSMLGGNPSGEDQHRLSQRERSAKKPF